MHNGLDANCRPDLHQGRILHVRASGSLHVRVLLHCLEFLTLELLISLCELL